MPQKLKLPASARLNGSVNPNGAATNYHFEWGTSISYGNTTGTVSAGSGTSAVSVLSTITGLTPGTTYHFRVAGTNIAGTSYGNDLTFIPGSATLTTAAVSAITTTGATSGGTITSDGGSAITAHVVCWGTSVNPTVTGSHTTDGSGTGSFTSSISGLSSSASYHVRAFGTNPGVDILRR
ncbi:MAG: fibronectin type III domain-containing protein [Bacteroidetes bacterium]|nr:fibronectin type III domain-containing protein [Bacteroidota bacterium]